MLCQKDATPSQELLSLNPEITGLTEIVDFKRFYGTRAQYRVACSRHSRGKKIRYDTVSCRGGVGEKTSWE